MHSSYQKGESDWPLFFNSVVAACAMVTLTMHHTACSGVTVVECDVTTTELDTDTTAGRGLKLLPRITEVNMSAFLCTFRLVQKLTPRGRTCTTFYLIQPSSYILSLTFCYTSGAQIECLKIELDHIHRI